MAQEAVRRDLIVFEPSVLEDNRLAEIEAALRGAIEAEPTSASLFVGLGDALRALDRRGDAIESYNRALALNPDCAEALFGLGLCELHPLRRIHAFSDAVVAKPDFARAHLARGEALLVLGRTIEGLDALRRAQSLAPEDLELLSRCGESMMNAGLDHDAVLFLEQAIAEHPIGDHSAVGLSALYLALASALTRLGREDDASEARRAADYLLPEPTIPEGRFAAPTDPMPTSFEVTEPSASRTHPTLALPLAAS